MDDWAFILETARRCATHASQRCREFASGALAARRKADKTWVTAADEAIEHELRAMITEAHPGHAILGEEHGASKASDDSEIQWILDPIDGTFSFVHGIPFYSSLIAVFQKGEPIVGVATLPGLGIEMRALKGQGVWIGEDRYVRPARVGDPGIEIVATADPYRFRMEGQGTVLDQLYAEPRKARTYPDALGYYLLLLGSVRAFVDPKVEVWDVAPFHVILPEAGFAIQSWDGHRKPARGTSVAYAVDGDGRPLHCDDVLQVLDPK